MQHDDLVKLKNGQHVDNHALASVRVYHSSEDETLLYYVMKFSPDRIICTCPGWRYNDDCWHVKDVRKSADL